MSALLILTWLTPLLAAALATSARFWWLPVVAALPALAAAVLVPAGHQVEISWLLMGTVLGLDEAGRIFLAFTAVLWLAAGLYGAGSLRGGTNAGRFQSLFLLAMAGNFWLVVGLDLVSFYLGFSLMGLASYGLVVHDGDRLALRAGKVYVIMTIAAELALFVALVMIADHAGGLVPSREELAGLGDGAVALLLFGLAIKAGLVPLHVWLPLAHPAAPVPASAVLSGAMIKVALLGWLRFLPVGIAPMTEWGLLLLVLGLVTLFYAIPVGLVQSNPKVILAYSSVSKMGLMSLTLGLMLLEPTLAVSGVAALSLYAAHHALVKGALFLGVGLRHHAAAQALVLTGTLLLALSLAGVPGSSGAVAKYGIKPIIGGTGWAWVTTAVTISTVGTALLMARFVWVIWRTEPHPSPRQGLCFIGWGSLLVLSLAFSLLLGDVDAWQTNALTLAAALIAIVPFAVVAWRRRNLLRPSVDMVPAGDLLALARPVLSVLSFIIREAGRWWSGFLALLSTGVNRITSAVGPAPADPERGLRSWPNAGASWLIITASLLLIPLGPSLVPWKPELAGDSRSERPAGTEPFATSSETSSKDSQAPAAADSTISTRADAPASAREELPNPLPELAEYPEPPADNIRAAKDPASAPDALRESANVVREPVVTPASAPGPLPDLETGSVATQTQPPALAPDAATPAPQMQASDIRAEGAETPEPEGESPELPCDPDGRFVFGHPEVQDTLRLVDCLQTEGGAQPADAPSLTNQLVLMVQHHLNDLGHDAGPADGLIGPRTRKAIRQFQLSEGRRSTGTIDFELLRDLERAQNESERR